MPNGRLFFLTPESVNLLESCSQLEYPIAKLTTFTEHKDIIRRGGVVSVIKLVAKFYYNFNGADFRIEIAASINLLIKLYSRLKKKKYPFRLQKKKQQGLIFFPLFYYL